MIGSHPQRTHAIIISLLLSHNLFGHCLGNDKPFFEIPTLSSINVTHRSSFCDIYEDVFENGTIEMRDALRGRNLTVGIFDSQINNFTGGIDNSDMSVMVLDELARRAGFEWRGSYGVIDSPAESNKYTFTDILYWTTNVYDLMGDYYHRNEERLEAGVDFIEPHTDGSFVMVMKKSSGNNKIPWGLFWAPFSPQLWIILIFNGIISGVFYFFVDYLDSRRKSKKMEHTLSGNVFLAAYAFTEQSLYHPQTVSTKIVAWSLCFIYLVLISIYTANMANLLIIRQTSLISINTMDDVIKEDLSVCVWKSASSERFLSENYPSAKTIAFYTEDECAEALLNGDCDIYLAFDHVWEKLKRDVTYNGDCHLESVGKTYQENGGSFALKDKNELCSMFLSHILSLHMIDMKLDGTLEKILEDYYEQEGFQNCENDSNDPENKATMRLEVYQTASLFVIHYMIMLFALALSVVKCQLMPQEKKDRIKEEIWHGLKRPKMLIKASSFANRYSKDVVSQESLEHERSLYYNGGANTRCKSESTKNASDDNNTTQRQSHKEKYHQEKKSNKSDTDLAVVYGDEKSEIIAEDTVEHVSCENLLSENQQYSNKSMKIQFLEAMADFIQKDLDKLSRKKSK